MTDLQLYFNYLSNGNFVRAFDLINQGRVHIDARNDSGETGLMIAASAGKNYYVNKFINHGANTLLQDGSGNNALLKATVSNNSETVALILTKADIDQREGLVTASNNSGYNSLTTAARLGLDQCLKEMLSIVPEAISSQDSYSRDALMTAVYHNKIDLLPTLKHFGARADSIPTEEDSSIADANNPVVLAAQTSEEMLKALREFPGFDINSVGVDGISPLIAASTTNNYKAIFFTLDFCIKNGANVDHQDSIGNTALHYILKSGNDASEFYVAEIMKKNPDLTLVGSDGQSITQLAYAKATNLVIKALGLPVLPEVDESLTDGTYDAEMTATTDVSSVDEEMSSDRDMTGVIQYDENGPFAFL